MTLVAFFYETNEITGKRYMHLQCRFNYICMYICTYINHIGLIQLGKGYFGVEPFLIEYYNLWKLALCEFDVERKPHSESINAQINYN